MRLQQIFILFSVIILSVDILNAQSICGPGVCRYGECEQLVTGYVCHCIDRVKGKNCDRLLGSTEDRCLRNPCWNNGVCQGTATTFTCQCPSGTSGFNCKTLNDVPCTIKCQNGGLCISNKCVCSDRFSGAFCEVPNNEVISALPRSVYVLNKGGYTALLTLSYKIGNLQKEEKATVTSAMSKRFEFDSQAYDAVLKVSALAGKSNFLVTDITKTQECFHVWGTTLYPAQSRMNC